MNVLWRQFWFFFLYLDHRLRLLLLLLLYFAVDAAVPQFVFAVVADVLFVKSILTTPYPVDSVVHVVSSSRDRLQQVPSSSREFPSQLVCHPNFCFANLIVVDL